MTKEEKKEYNKNYRLLNKEYDYNYRTLNKEKIKEYRLANRDQQKEYRNLNKDKTKAYRDSNKNKDREKQYREQHKEEAKKYREANREKARDYAKAYTSINKDYFSEYAKKYSIDNKDKIASSINLYLKKRRSKDPLFKMQSNLRTRIYSVFRRIKMNKPANTLLLLGADYKPVMVHIEERFTFGMGWDNYGEWHIDHIIPLSSAKNEKDLIKLCHYTNLQPLWKEDNIKKGNKLDYKLSI